VRNNTLILLSNRLSKPVAEMQFRWVCSGLFSLSITQSSAFIKTIHGGSTRVRVFVLNRTVLDLENFLTAKTGLVVGLLGFIEITIDGGVSWLNVSTDTIITLYLVCFDDPNTGFAVVSTYVHEIT
jgi:hypothetical protein